MYCIIQIRSRNWDHFFLRLNYYVRKLRHSEDGDAMINIISKHNKIVDLENDHRGPFRYIYYIYNYIFVTNFSRCICNSFLIKYLNGLCLCIQKTPKFADIWIIKNLFPSGVDQMPLNSCSSLLTISNKLLWKTFFIIFHLYSLCLASFFYLFNEFILCVNSKLNDLFNKN